MILRIQKLFMQESYENEHNFIRVNFYFTILYYSEWNMTYSS